jgi:serine/threonine protein kinase
MLLVNEILHNRYRVIRQLGRGGMGAVYEAHDNVFDTTIALKEIMIDMAKTPSPEQQESIKNAFEREAKLLAKIKHETVPHVRDYFSDANRQFLVMELVEGKELGELLDERKSPFPLEDVLRWAEQLLDGLDYLHTQNPPIYHRDIKPQNLKLTNRGKIKLLDFGIAKGGGGAEANNSASIGNQTFVAATLNYSPIEQTFRVLDPVFREVLLQRFNEQVNKVMAQNADARTDIYALGATVYHLLTGRLPIDSLKRTTEIWAGKPDPLIHPSNLNDRIPPEISAILLKSMEIDRDKRFSSALDMQQALNQANNSIKAREKNQSKNWQDQQPPTVWQSGGDEQSQVPTLETQQKDLPTMQIPVEQLRQGLQSTSEQTIQGNPQNYAQTPINTAGGGQNPPSFGSSFDTGGNAPFPTSGGQPQPPTENYNFAGVSTDGSVSNPVITGGQSFSPQGFHANQPYIQQTAVQQEKTGRKFLWLIPIFILLFLVVGGGAVGVWIWQQSQNEAEKTPTPTPKTSPSVSPSASPSVKTVDSPTPTKEETPSTNPNNPQTPRPTIAPKTPSQQKTPAQQKTPKPKKSVSVDDIINDAE